jgi:hypothetical protein
LGELTKQRQERAAILENVRRMRAALDEQAKMLATYQNQIDSLTRNQAQVFDTLTARREEKAAYDQVIHSAEAIEKAYQEWQAARDALQAMEEVAAQFRQREALRHEPLRLIETEKARLEEIRQGLIEQRTSLENALAGELTLIEHLGLPRGDCRSTREIGQASGIASRSSAAAS